MAGGRLAAILHLTIHNSLTAKSVSMKAESVSKSVVSNSDRDGVFSHLMCYLGGSLDNRLDHGMVSYGVSRGEADGSGMGVTQAKELGVSLSLHNQVSESVSVSESIGSMGGQDRGGDNDVMGEGRVVNEGGGGSQHLGVSCDDGGISLNNSVMKTVSIAQTGNTETIGGVSDRNNGVVHHGGVVNQGSGWGQNLRVSSDDSGISLYNSVMKPIAETISGVGYRNNGSSVVHHRGVVN